MEGVWPAAVALAVAVLDVVEGGGEAEGGGATEDDAHSTGRTGYPTVPPCRRRPRPRPPALTTPSPPQSPNEPPGGTKGTIAVSLRVERASRQTHQVTEAETLSYIVFSIVSFVQ